MKKQTGKQLQKSLVDAGHNALWIKGRGMIIMPNMWGCDVSVSGKYHLLSTKTCSDILEGLECAEHAEYAAWENNAPTYIVR